MNAIPKVGLKPETLALHAGWRADPTTGAIAVPIFQTASYQFADVAHASSLFSPEKLGFTYSRTGNPTVDVLEQRLAALEGGVGALAVGSGQAASAFSVLGLAQAGDNIVSSTDLYGGTWNLFQNTLDRLGIEVRFVDPAEPGNFARATDFRTRAYYGETLPNPKLVVFPIAEVAAIGRSVGIPLILDNTAAPLLARPLDHGAAIVVYSATKYLGGHGTSIGGAIIDGGNFDWAAWPDRQPALNKPDSSYHGAIWVEAATRLGVPAYVARVRSSVQRDLGAPLAPFNAFQILQGVETLALRMKRHARNAAAVAKFLTNHTAVRRVIYPSLQTDIAQQRARRYLTGGFGGLVGFELHGGAAGAARFVDALRIFLSRRQYRRRTQPCHPSGEHHTRTAFARSAGAHRR